MKNNLQCHIVATPETTEVTFDRTMSEAMIMSIEMDMKVLFEYAGKTYTVDYNEWFHSILENAK